MKNLGKERLTAYNLNHQAGLLRSLEGRKFHLILKGKWVMFKVHRVDKVMSGCSLRVS